MRKFFSLIASKTAIWMGQPSAFIAAVAACVIWGVSGPVFHYSDTWQLVINTATTVLTFLAVFLIQNSQNRDGAAIQAKLDELLRALETARSQFIGIEHLGDKQIELIRTALERQAKSEKPAGAKGKPPRAKQARAKQPGAKQKTAPDTVDRLLDRF